MLQVQLQAQSERCLQTLPGRQLTADFRTGWQSRAVYRRWLVKQRQMRQIKFYENVKWWGRRESKRLEESPAEASASPAVATAHIYM